MSGVDRLRRLSETLPALGDDGEWLATAIAGYLDGSADLDDALGIKTRPGQLRPATAAAIAERNRHLREAAARFGLGAVDLAVELQRYASSSWNRERHFDDCPPRHHGRLNEHFWRALNAWPRVIRERQIKTILGN